jgi:adenylosuccinate lyase
MHEHLRLYSLAAWEALATGHPNPLPELLCNSPELTAYLSPVDIRAMLNASTYIGDAPERARTFAAHLRRTLNQG